MRYAESPCVYLWPFYGKSPQLINIHNKITVIIGQKSPDTFGSRRFVKYLAKYLIKSFGTY